MGRRVETSLSYASGYLSLKMVEEARLELALISPHDCNRRDVLEARLDFHMTAKEWALVVEFGQQLARLHPEVARGWIVWAYGLRELQLITDARDVLLEAEALHGATSPVLHFNLACYFCLLGEVAIARERVRKACGLDQAFKAVALDDPDLAAMWASG